MKRVLFILLLFGVVSVMFSQSRKGCFFLHNGCEQHELYVSFYTDGFLYSKENSNTKIKIDQLKKTYSFSLCNNTLLSDSKIDELSSNRGIKSIENSVQKLKRIYKISMLEPTNEKLYELAVQFEELEEVEYASLVPLTPIKPPYDIMPVTDDYEYLQTYLAPDPGVNMYYAWSLGLTGQNIKIRDVEYGFNANHEVLNERNVSISPSMDISSEASVAYTEHGTAVFGMVYAGNCDYGIKGMVHGAEEMILFPEWQSSGYNRINAVSKAIENSSAGDVIIYEMQYPAYPNNPNDESYVPAEFHNVVWDLTKAATDAGIIVVAAAGNGAQNLDLPYFNSYIDRGNSGAIIVGAGSNTIAHSPLYFTTYGSRVDVQAWGGSVFTSGYGNLFQIGKDFNQGYTMFSGTSSATPIVASCVITLQSYYHSLTGEYLTSRDMRDLLVETGIPQKQNLTKPIGPFPNMQTAIETINSMISCDFPVDVWTETDENCMVHIYWETPQDTENITFNIYRNNQLVAENIEETSYSEYINPGDDYEWSVRTVCSEGLSRKMRLHNESCPYLCNPATDLSIELTTNCLFNLKWTSDYNDESTVFNVYKNNELVAENISLKSYTEIIESEKQFEWCVEVSHEGQLSPKRCIINEKCQAGNIPENTSKKMYEFYPNPVKNELTIKRLNSNFEMSVIEIYTINGTNIHTEYIENELHQISFDKFPSGVFMLKIYDSEQVIVRKIVKQ